MNESAAEIAARASFKINNHWSARLSRWFTAKHPHLAGFFEQQREQHGEGG